MTQSVARARLRSSAVAAATVLAGFLGVVADPAAAATPAVANLQTEALKIPGRTLGSGASIPAGTVLQRVSATTEDPDAGPQGPLGLNNDPFTLVQGEAVTLRIDGVVVATTMPALRATALHTDAGTFTVLVFSVGGNSYAIPQYNQSIAAVSRTVERSTLNVGAVGSTVTYWYGLLPQGSVARAGTVFTETTEVGTVTRAGAGDYLLYDADSIRGNGDSVGDELLLVDLKGAPSNGSVGRLSTSGASEVLATVQFDDGTILVARAVRYDSFGAYTSSSSYLLDRAALAAAGQSVRTMARVLSTSPSPHGLTWQLLGFAG